MPLTNVEPGKRVYIIGLNAGQAMQGRLAAMGLLPGVQIEVIASSAWGPIIVAVKGSRVILGHGMAQKVMVA
jgi:Fe2+ transport system protein FeoA